MTWVPRLRDPFARITRTWIQPEFHLRTGEKGRRIQPEFSNHLL